jgi:quinol-cytochrome oxidoreductase complex cytochrome b subunit
MLAVFVSLRLLPWAHKPNTRGPQFRLIHQILRVAVAADYVLLSYLGQCPVEDPYVIIGQI